MNLLGGAARPPGGIDRVALLATTSTYSVCIASFALDIVVDAAYLSSMATTAAHSTPKASPAPSARERQSRVPSGLPPGFDPVVWTREACERSGVPVGVTDPVALAKLRVLTRPER